MRLDDARLWVPTWHRDFTYRRLWSFQTLLQKCSSEHETRTTGPEHTRLPIQGRRVWKLQEGNVSRVPSTASSQIQLLSYTPIQICRIQPRPLETSDDIILYIGKCQCWIDSSCRHGNSSSERTLPSGKDTFEYDLESSRLPVCLRLDAKQYGGHKRGRDML